MKILIAEDEKTISSSLKKNFLAENFEVTTATNGTEALQKIEKEKFEIILLDWRMPGMSGFEVCKKIRSMNIDTPVILLTALSGIQNKVEALEVGADDYITKPFEFEEVLARIKAVLRRSQQSLAILKFNNFTLNMISHELESPAGKTKLSDRETELLKYFVKNKGKIISKDELCSKVWDLDFSPGTNVIEATVKNLRKKIDQYTSEKLIRTVYGEGYIFVAD